MITLDAIELGNDLVWIDEFDWTPAKQQENYTLTGALVIELGIKQAGRPLTLAESTLPVWLPRETVLALYDRLYTGQSMTLTLNDGRQFNVVFNHNQSPLQLKPVTEYSVLEDSDPYNVNAIKFLIV